MCMQSYYNFHHTDFSSNMFTGVNSGLFNLSERRYAVINPTHYSSIFDETIYGSDEFRMFYFKIKQCIRTRSHDWTECPFAHRGEKAQRRDPRNYLAIACPEFRNGSYCPRGHSCLFAHGVFEYWLHPAKYRTRACTSGVVCNRKVCFFAHTPEQLRPETKYRCHYMCRDHADRAAESKDDNRPRPEAGGAVTAACSGSKNDKNGSFFEGGEFEFVKSLRALKINEGDGGGEEVGDFGLDGSGSDLPHVDWISDLVK